MSHKCLVQFDNIGVIDVFDDGDFFGNHLYLLFVQSLRLYHFDSITLNFSFFATLVDIAGCPRSYLFDELVVIYLFQNLTHY